MKIIRVSNIENFAAKVSPKQPQKNKSIVELILKNVQKNGGKVYFAEDGQAAVNYCLELAQKNNVKSVVKG